HLFWGAAVALFSVRSITSLAEAGLNLKKRLSHADTGPKAEQAGPEALQELPDDYHVFHDLSHFLLTLLEHVLHILLQPF
ncbi:MAG: hypothetical protein KMY51_05500, partial [Desulfomicrobium sp.]|nr:hypothetical protein [Desulfomicrobium sp.]